MPCFVLIDQPFGDGLLESSGDLVPELLYLILSWGGIKYAPAIKKAFCSN